MKRILGFDVDVMFLTVRIEKDGQIIEKHVSVNVVNPRDIKIEFNEGEYDGEVEDYIKTLLEVKKMKDPEVFKGYLLCGPPREVWKQ